MAFEHTITNLPVENEYPKLVRDNIPEIIREADGRDVPVRTLENNDEFVSFSKKKVVEEAMELAATETDAHLLEEIADVRELIEALMKAKGFTPEQVQAVQDEKRAKRGGFELRLLMLNND